MIKTKTESERYFYKSARGCINKKKKRATNKKTPFFERIIARSFTSSFAKGEKKIVMTIWKKKSHLYFTPLVGRPYSMCNILRLLWFVAMMYKKLTPLYDRFNTLLSINLRILSTSTYRVSMHTKAYVVIRVSRVLLFCVYVRE